MPCTRLSPPKRIREERCRVPKYVEEVVPMYSDVSFQRHFRVSRDTLNTIVTHLKDCQEFVASPAGRPVIPVTKQVMITLCYLGTLDTIYRIADRFGVSESAVLDSRNTVISAVLMHMKNKLISWPNQAQKQFIADFFERKTGFPGILGCLDGTHIKIHAPSEGAKSYVNRKGYHSIQLQAVCREDLSFIHCFTGFPGSCHDSRILKNSDLWDHGRDLCEEDHILADGGYPLQHWIMTPYRDNGHLSPQQRHFNTVLSTNRVAIERAFGLLKGRFPRMNMLHVTKVETAVKIIMTCCVFHNICIQQSDLMTEFMQRDNDIVTAGVNPIGGVQHAADSVLKRDRIAAQLP